MACLVPAEPFSFVLIRKRYGDKRARHSHSWMSPRSLAFRAGAGAGRLSSSAVSSAWRRPLLSERLGSAQPRPLQVRRVAAQVPCGCVGQRGPFPPPREQQLQAVRGDASLLTRPRGPCPLTLRGRVPRSRSPRRREEQSFAAGPREMRRARRADVCCFSP